MTFSDFSPAGNQGGNPEVYEIENRALDPDGLVLAAMRKLAPWRDRTLVDLGCGSGFWLPRYADDAAQVIGVEPDARLVPLATARDGRARVVAGSAEHIPLDDATADVVHARFAYFFPPGVDAGLAEVLRVLRPGGISWSSITISEPVTSRTFSSRRRGRRHKVRPTPPMPGGPNAARSGSR